MKEGLKVNIELTAKRLKELREKAGYSHAKLQDALKDKYNIDISIVSLKKYEISQPYHAQYGMVKGMKIEYLNMFADFYNVSTDYILGRTNSTSVDLTEKFIYEKFGLSSNTIKNLNQLWNEKKKYTSFVFDFMLSNIDFLNNFSRHLLKYCEYEEEAFEFVRKSIISKKPDEAKQDIKKHGEKSDIKRGMQRYLIINEIESFIGDFFVEFQHIKHKLSLENEDFKNYERWGNNGNENK